MKTNLFFTYNLKCILFWIWMHIKLLWCHRTKICRYELLNFPKPSGVSGVRQISWNSSSYNLCMNRGAIILAKKSQKPGLWTQPASYTSKTSSAGFQFWQNDGWFYSIRFPHMDVNNMDVTFFLSSSPSRMRYHISHQFSFSRTAYPATFFIYHLF